jgi:site-specific recombinase XerD
VASLLQAFFTERLMRQRRASPHTIAAYRDSFRLLLRFMQQRMKKPPSALTLAELDAPAIGTFLNYLEEERNCGARSRNARLAAIHSFFQYLALEEPAHSALIERVLAIPTKRFKRAIIGFLTQPEIEALLAVPDQTQCLGRRDHALLLLGVQTGLRASELIGLRCRDVVLDTGPHVHCTGKGRKQRCTPLTRQTARVIRRWLKERGSDPDGPLFPSSRGGHLSRDGLEHLIAKHARTARKNCSSLRGKRISAHVLRHSAAMTLLHAGVDRATIALWLGHESSDTTQVYFDADLALKEKALAKTAPPGTRVKRYRPGDKLITFLDEL